MEIIGLLAGKNKVKDYQIRGIDSSMLNGGIIEGLEINETGCSIGKCLILIERTNGQKFLVDFYNTEFKNLTLGNDKKIYIEIPQNNIDDGNTFSVNTDGTGIAEIKVGNEFPNKNFVALAETDEIGEITDLREIISFKGLVRKDLKPNSIIFVNSDGDEQLLEFNPETDNGKAIIINQTNGLKLESPAVNIGSLDETTTLNSTDEFIVNQSGNKKINQELLVSGDIIILASGEPIFEGDAVVIHNLVAYRGDANNTDRLNFIGFAMHDSGVLPVAIKTSGIGKYKSSITSNTKYYLSTGGNIGTSPGLNEIFVGYGTSGNNVLINRGDLHNRVSGRSMLIIRDLSTGSGNVNYFHNMDKIPKFILFQSFLQTGTSTTSDWSFGGYSIYGAPLQGISPISVGANSFSSNTYVINWGNNAHYATVSSLTKDRLTLSWTRASGSGTLKTIAHFIC